MSERREHIEGYHAPIHRGVWERILVMGAPRMLSTLWLVLSLYAGLVVLTVCGVRWVVLPLVVWAVGHGVLVLLTQWDSAFDDLIVAHLRKHGTRWGYQSFYDAG
jgi:type IV secretion system protein VirB3